jgi:hypothetical protein
MAAKSHGFGDAPEDVRKDELIEFLRRVAATLDPVMRARSEPVVLAALPELQGHFRAMVDWPGLVETPLAENPDALDAATLHARARAVVEPRVAAHHAGDLDRLNALLGRDGRVDTLFVADGEGLQNPGAAAGQGDDLFDCAAIETLRHRGHIDVLPKQRLPRQRPLAAILRY